MLNLSLTLLRLVSSKHFDTSLTMRFLFEIAALYF